nr:TPA_asm: m44.7 sORF 1 [Murid betaherpesvirus 1]DBA07776.1 TPA_asm: m44.7 sORF 1 [Murid betaherpesvirus 1]
MSHILSPELSR